MTEDARSGGGDVELAETFASVARTLLAANTLEETLDTICRLAVQTIEGCEHAGVSLIQRRSIETRGASDPVPHAVDKVQYEADEGPCLDAMRDEETIRADDLSREPRWSHFAERAAKETGVNSILSFRLFVEKDTMGALNLYSTRVDAFDEETERVGAVFAAHAAVAMAGAREAQQKDEAIRTRDVIGQAKGIVMARQGVSEDEAFDVLRRASQRMNIKLREVAEQVARRPTGA